MKECLLHCFSWGSGEAIDSIINTNKILGLPLDLSVPEVTV